MSSVRRALTSRRLFLLFRRPASTTIAAFQHSPQPLYNSPYYRSSAADQLSLAGSFFNESRRGYAKGRRQAYDDDDDGYEDAGSDNGGVNIAATAKAAAASQMDAAIDALSRELLKLRSGRASPGMLDHIIVESSGMKISLSRMAVVSVIDSKTLSVTPFDPNTLKELEKAIVSSPLGLNPKSADQRLIASIPPLTKEHMQAVCKVVAKSAEDAKQSIRRARQKALDMIKKAVPKKTNDSKKKGKDKETPDTKKKSGPSFSADDAKRLEKEIDELTKKYIKSAEDMCKSKEKEITAG